MDKYKKLKNILLEYAREDVCIAFSGGVDSSLLLVMACEAAKKTKKKVYGVTFDTVLHPKADIEVARQVLSGTGAIHEVLHIDELAVPEIRSNPVDRCYLCKRELYTRLRDFARKKNIPTILEGSNEDDLHVYRPGLLAVRELDIKSPLAICGITKEEVRELAAQYGLSVAKRPSAPCLATRLPYGTEIDLALLARIEEGERFLRDMGFQNVRIRIHGDVLRLECDLQDMGRLMEKREEIVSGLKRVGCVYITFDLEGFRSGSMDIKV